MASGVSVWQHPSFLRGLDQLLVDMADVPTANVLAMRDAALGFRYRDGVPVPRAGDGT